MMIYSPFVERFIKLYGGLNKQTLHYLGELYSQDIQFIDAVHEINGLNDLESYFEHLYSNLKECHFHIHHVVEKETPTGGEASLFWTMSYIHPKINKGAQITVDGTTLIKFTDKVHYHRDYIDMGQMLYEHLPVIGPMVKFIKKRVQS